MYVETYVVSSTCRENNRLFKKKHGQVDNYFCYAYTSVDRGCERKHM